MSNLATIKKALQELYRVLKPGGYIEVSEVMHEKKFSTTMIATW